MKINIFVELNGEKTEVRKIETAFKEVWKESGRKASELETADLYFKPDEKTCYYFIPQNGESGKISF